MLLLPVVLYSIPTNGIFNGETTCLFSRFLDIECWGCGITRAFFSLLYGKFIQAWEYNPLIVPLFPLLIWMWGKEVWKALKELKQL
ncbi:MAG: DUF2752 domain-containing protein [Bacteroidaceae bacterium]|nr:DUF2752 domain-containing protein [Bacteroidaceae bacterium]